MLDIRNLSKQYGPVQALHDVSFQAPSGAVTALLGENGAGKSTIVKILSGLTGATSGEIWIDGEPVKLGLPEFAKAAGIAVAQQEISVLPNLTVAENFALAESRIWLDRRRAEKECLPYLRQLGLDHINPRELVGNLTIGERQLVEIARMLAQKARVLVLDEPTAALSDRDIDLLLRAVRNLAADGRTILYITHRLNEVHQICDKVVVLRNGGLAADQTAADFSIPRIVDAMVGRQLDGFFPSKQEARETGPGRGLSFNGVLTPGLMAPLNFSVSRGEIVACTGQIGSGFVEPLRAAAGLVNVTAGTIVSDDKVVSGDQLADRVASGIVYCSDDRQRDGFFANRTVWENLSAPVLASKGLWKFVRDKPLRYIASQAHGTVAISSDKLSTAVSSLSGGNAQKVAIGKWMSRRPRIFLIEEPTRGVDVGARAEIYQSMRRLVDEGMLLIFASTDIDEILGFADRVVAFKDGRQEDILKTSETSREEVIAIITHGGRHVAA